MLRAAREKYRAGKKQKAEQIIEKNNRQA